MSRTLARAAVLALLFAAPAARAIAQSGDCAGALACTEVASFTAAVTDFRASVEGPTRLVTATVRFRNRTDHVLRLGYVAGSGIVTDDQGNRYVVARPASVRGIGIVDPGSFDPKFALQPGESSDARIEFAWRPGREIIGSRFTLEATVREMVPVTATQLRLGREHALQFRGLGAPVVTAGRGDLRAVAAGVPSAADPMPAPPVTPPGVPRAPDVRQTSGSGGDPCAGAARCYAAGPFTAQITSLGDSRVGDFHDHVLRFTLRLRNVSAQPLVLAYQGRSGAAADELGNRYYYGRPGADQSASGIGVVYGGHADPQFVLEPGQARDATFQLIRFRPGNTAIGTRFSYDLTLTQLEVLNGGQVRSVRDYAVGFRDVTPGTTGATLPGLAQDPANAVRAGSRLIDALRRRARPR